MNIEAAVIGAIATLWALILVTACVAPFVRDAWNTFQLGRATIRLYDGEDDPRASAWKVTQLAHDLERLKRDKVKANPPRLPSNVVRIHPRITSRGRPLHFEGPGAA